VHLALHCFLTIDQSGLQQCASQACFDDAGACDNAGTDHNDITDGNNCPNLDRRSSDNDTCAQSSDTAAYVTRTHATAHASCDNTGRRANAKACARASSQGRLGH
jgi:hypothetical protein